MLTTKCLDHFILEKHEKDFQKILGNPGVIHSVPTAFIIHDECSGYVMDLAFMLNAVGSR